MADETPSPAPAVSAPRPSWAEDLTLAPLSFWADADASLQTGVLNADDFYLTHRQRAHDEENPLLAEVRKGLGLPPVPPEPEPEVPEVSLEVTKAAPAPRSAVGDVAAGLVRGPLVALDETIQGLGTLAQAVTGIPFDSTLALFTEMGPTAPESVAGQLAQGLTQFLTALVPISRGVKLATGASTLVSGLLASPLADFFAFDAQDPRFANLIEETFPSLSTPITQYLQATGDESELEGRLKNVLEGVLLEGAAGSVLGGLRFLKSGRAVVQEVRRSERGAVEIPGPGVVPPSVLPDTPATLAQQYADAVVEARRGGPRPHAAVVAEAEGLIEAGTVSLETVRRLVPGSTLNDAEAVAVVKVLAQSGQRLRTLAATALETGHPADVDAVMQQLYLHGAVDPKRIGVVTEAGRTLSAMNEPTSGLNRFLVQFEEVLRNATLGTDPLAIVRAIADLKDPDQLAILAHQTSKPGFWDMFKEYYVNGLLWGPKTWMANLIGNTATTLWSIPERGLAGLMGGGRGVQAGEAWALLHGVLGSVGDAWRLAAEAFRAEESQFARLYGTAEGVARATADKIELPPKAISAQTLDLTGPAGHAVDFLGTLIRFPTRVLAGTDDFFKVINYRGELRAQALRLARQDGLARGLDGKEFRDFVTARQDAMLADPPLSAKRAADAHALYQTFTQELGETGQALQRLASTPAGKIILPFVRTPINIFKYATERTPMGLFAKDMRSPDLATADLARAKVALGSFTMSLAGLLAYEGLITGGGPKDPEQQRHLKALGWQPYSLRLGNTFVSFSRTEPVGMLLGIAADWVEAVVNAEGQDLEWAGEVGAALVTAVAKNFSSRTFVKGVAETFAALADPERAAQSRTSSFLVSLLPASGLLRQVEQATDPTMAEARTVLDRVLAQIPGLSRTLPPRRDLFGDPIYLTGIYGPIAVNTMKDDPVLRALVKLKVNAPEIPKVLERIELTAEERDYWAVQRGTMRVDGQTLHGTLEATMAGEEYRGANRDHRAFLLELDIRRFQNESRLKVEERYPIIRRSIDAAREQKAQQRTAPPTPESITPLLRSLIP